MIKREQEIFNILYQMGEISISGLAIQTRVSQLSIRRDLQELDGQRFIDREHGRVKLATAVNYERVPVYRLPADQGEVRRIACRAMQMIKPGDVIGLSGGSLCTQLALMARHLEGLIIVTNAVNIAVEMACLPGIQVKLTGGLLNPGSFELVGASIEASLNGLHIDKFFVGTDGVSIKNGVTGHDEAESRAAASIMQKSDETILLADSTKFSKASFAQVAPISDIQILITTNEAPQCELQEIQAAGVKVLIA